jgi:hypothetical protein
MYSYSAEDLFGYSTEELQSFAPASPMPVLDDSGIQVINISEDGTQTPLFDYREVDRYNAAQTELQRRAEVQQQNAASQAALADQQAQWNVLQQRAERQRNDQLGQQAAFAQAQAEQQKQIVGMQDAAANVASSLSIIGNKTSSGPTATQTKRSSSAGNKTITSRAPGPGLRADTGVGLNIGT